MAKLQEAGENMMQIVTVIVILMVMPCVSWADDGAIEINQACVADGCFDGDGPGFPVNIRASGVYRLTSNLEVVGDEFGIFVTTDVQPVEIDLNGFAVIGENECIGKPVTSCSEVNTGWGIVSRSSRVRDGRISGFEVGLSCKGCEAVNLRVSHNYRRGIDANIAGNEEGLVVRNCVVESNGGPGVLLDGWGNLVEGSVVRYNDGNGITGGDTGIVRGNTVSNNALGSAFSDNMLVTGNSFDSGSFSGGVSPNKSNRCGTTAC